MSITKIWTFIFNFNYDTTPLWYLYMLVGLYFIIPIFHAWLERATDLETEKKIHRMTDYCRVKVADYVPDPYYGGAQGFENVLDILEDACAGLLTSLVPDN